MSGFYTCLYNMSLKKRYFSRSKKARILITLATFSRRTTLALSTFSMFPLVFLPMLWMWGSTFWGILTVGSPLLCEKQLKPVSRPRRDWTGLPREPHVHQKPLFVPTYSFLWSNNLKPTCTCFNRYKRDAWWTLRRQEVSVFIDVFRCFSSHLVTSSKSRGWFPNSHSWQSFLVSCRCKRTTRYCLSFLCLKNGNWPQLKTDLW